MYNFALSPRPPMPLMPLVPHHHHPQGAPAPPTKTTIPPHANSCHP